MLNGGKENHFYDIYKCQDKLERSAGEKNEDVQHQWICLNETFWGNTLMLSKKSPDNKFNQDPVQQDTFSFVRRFQ